MLGIINVMLPGESPCALPTTLCIQWTCEPLGRGQQWGLEKSPGPGEEGQAGEVDTVIWFELF